MFFKFFLLKQKWDCHKKLALLIVNIDEKFKYFRIRFYLFVSKNIEVNVLGCFKIYIFVSYKYI